METKHIVHSRRGMTRGRGQVWQRMEGPFVKVEVSVGQGNSLEQSVVGSWNLGPEKERRERKREMSRLDTQWVMLEPTITEKINLTFRSSSKKY